jgi:hypothetical protein
MRTRLFLVLGLMLLDGGCHPHATLVTVADPFYVLPADATDDEHFCIARDIWQPGGHPTLRCVTVGEVRRLVWSVRVADAP